MEEYVCAYLNMLDENCSENVIRIHLSDIQSHANLGPWYQYMESALKHKVKSGATSPPPSSTTT